MGVAGEIGERRLRSGEGRLGINEPVLPPQRREMPGEGRGTTEARDLAEEPQPTCRLDVGERSQEEPPEQAGQHPHRQQKAGLAVHPARAVERDPAARHNHMDMRVVGHCRAPAMQHGGGADPRAEMLGIGGDREQCLGGRAEQEIVDDCFVLVGDRGDLGRQREDDMEIGDRQRIGLAGREPIPRRRPLTLGTMAIAAGVMEWPAPPIRQL